MTASLSESLSKWLLHFVISEGRMALSTIDALCLTDIENPR